MAKQWFIYFQSQSPWALHNLIYDIVLILKPIDLIKWLVLGIGSMALTTYFNVFFFSTIVSSARQGLAYLVLLMLFESIASYCSLRQNQAKKTFVLEFLKHFRMRLNQRILSADWIKIKLSDQVEVRQKIEEASSSIQYLVEELIEQLREIASFVLVTITVLYICPLASVVIAAFYACFYRLHLRRKSKELLETKLKIIEKHDKLYSKYSLANANTYEYVIHHEKDEIISTTNKLKVDMESQWFLLDHLYAELGLKQNILSKVCTFLTIGVYCWLNGTDIFVIPLYHNLTSLTNAIDAQLFSSMRWLRLTKNYDIVKPILEEYEERVNAEQVELSSQLHIRDLSFRYKGKRDLFHLQLHGELTFRMGEAILITGKSGAGKSTFYDILNGSIPSRDYAIKVAIDDKSDSVSLHSIERCRTMVVQGSDMDYRSTIYSMITDIDEDQVKQQRTPELDGLVWELLRLVQIDDFARNDLGGDLDAEMENKLSGGQKTRLLLARALFRAHRRKASLLILDEPDQGLPAETTVNIIANIMRWHRTRGILILTLHTELARSLSFDQILHIDEGTITKVK